MNNINSVIFSLNVSFSGTTFIKCIHHKRADSKTITDVTRNNNGNSNNDENSMIGVARLSQWSRAIFLSRLKRGRKEGKLRKYFYPHRGWGSYTMQQQQHRQSSVYAPPVTCERARYR